MWCVSRSGIHDELQGLVCWRAVRQTSYVAKDGVTASGYSAEYTREIRAVSYSTVSDEIIPSNAKDTSLACHMEYLQPVRVFL